MLSLLLVAAMVQGNLPPNSTVHLDSTTHHVNQVPDTMLNIEVSVPTVAGIIVVPIRVPRGSDTANVGWLTVTTWDTTHVIDSTPTPPDTTTPPPVAQGCTGQQATTTAQLNASFSTDTLCTRGGTYGSVLQQLSGTGSKDKVYRCWRGERCILNGGGLTLNLQGNNVTFIGDWEVRNSTNQVCVNRRGDNVKMIYMVVHHCFMSGIGDYNDGIGGEDYGNIVFETGRQDLSSANNKDHGIYIGNDGTSAQRKYVDKNILFKNQAYGIHVWTSSPQMARFISMRGNFSFLNKIRPAVMLDGGTPIEGMVFDSNATWEEGGEVLQAGMFGGTNHKDLTFRYNYVPGQMTITRFASLDSVGNIRSVRDTVIVVKADKYEPGRKHILVQNPSQRASVQISGVTGNWKLVRVDTLSANANAYFGAGTTGTGSPVTIPLAGAPFAVYVLRAR